MPLLEYHKKTNRLYDEMACHFHSVYEIYYFFEGDCDIVVDGMLINLKPHTLVLIPPNALHGIRVNSKKDYIRNCLYVQDKDVLPERKHLLNTLMPADKKGQHGLIYENIEEYNLDRYFYNIKLLEKEPKDVAKFLEPVLVEALLSQIILIRDTASQSVSDNSLEKINEIAVYLNENITEDLDLDTIANKFYLSKNYLNRIFKQNTGITVIEYVRFKRVMLAKRFIQEGESAMNAALKVGFSDYSSFYRAYNKYLQASPREDLSRVESIHSYRLVRGSNKPELKKNI